MTSDHTTQTADSHAEGLQAARDLEGKHVLLAEDCVDQGRLYLKILQSAGAEVTLECSGKSALDAVCKSPTLFDAIVMDFQLPVSNGLEATWLLRELGYKGAIIAATAFYSEKLKQSWFQAGCDVFLKKPFSKQMLVSAIVLHTVPKKQKHSKNQRSGSLLGLLRGWLPLKH